MNVQTLKKSVAGGYIEQHTLNLTSKSFALVVHVIVNAVLKAYDLTFEHVSHFAFDDNQVGEWERIQLTELWVDAAPETSATEEWEVTISLWDLAHIRLRCMRVLVDGYALER